MTPPFRRLWLLALILALAGLAWGAPARATLEAWITGLGQRAEGATPLELGLTLAFATLVSEDLTCLAAGSLVAEQRLAFVPAATACFLGILVGDVLLFLAGRWLGGRMLARAPLRWFLDDGKVAEARRWLERRGGIVILSSRFLPGARLPTYFASGALGTSLVRFTLWFALAGILWTPSVVAFAAGLGGALGGLGGPGSDRAWVLLGTLASGALLLALARALASFRGRALLRARLRRWTRFEYWPIGVFYLPVFGLFLWRALRGEALVFTAANPALPHGGFVGESKADIYARLAAAGAPLPRTLALPHSAEPSERRVAVERFLSAHGLGFPLVLKPDAGQRGDGVRILRDEEALAQALERAQRHGAEAEVLQEFVAGEEYGLFWVQRPGAARGELFSITRKLLPEVIGDGRRTLERLILEDPTHLPMAPLFLARHADRLTHVPRAGERVLLGELGTHCRGARFLDGGALASEPLRQALERVVAAFPGFHFGRFDVRAPSAEALRAGRFTILELNGVTSEAAHIYDPGFGLLAAWRSLLQQWRLAYAIGRANARAGARVSRLSELREALAGYRALVARRAEPASVPVTPRAGPALVEVRS